MYIIFFWEYICTLDENLAHEPQNLRGYIAGKPVKKKPNCKIKANVKTKETAMLELLSLAHTNHCYSRWSSQTQRNTENILSWLYFVCFEYLFLTKSTNIHSWSISDLIYFYITLTGSWHTKPDLFHYDIDSPLDTPNLTPVCYRTDRNSDTQNLTHFDIKLTTNDDQYHLGQDPTRHKTILIQYQ